MRVMDRVTSFLARRYANKIIKNYYGKDTFSVQSSLVVIELSELIEVQGCEFDLNNIITFFDVGYFIIPSVYLDSPNFPDENLRKLIAKLTFQNDSRVLIHKIPLIGRVYVFILRAH